MSQHVIVINEAVLEEKYLVEIPDGFDIEDDAELGPLEYAQQHGEYLGAYAEDTNTTQVSRRFSSREQALKSEDGEINLPAAFSLDPLRQADVEKRIAAYVFELTPGDVRSLISADEAAQAGSDILRLVLDEFSARTEDRHDN
jgi:hypothetical protein